MQVIDFINKRGYEVISFPDGEKHLKINQLDRKDNVKIICRITNSDELFLLMQLSDILNRQCVVIEEIVIAYLMTMRCDRLFSLEQPFSLGVVANVINSFNARRVLIVEPHSKISLDLIRNSEARYTTRALLEYPTTVCFPDKGSFTRYADKFFKSPYIVCSKVRNVETGDLLSFKIDRVVDYKEGSDIIVADDLCDGGRTFVGIAKILRDLKPQSITLAVTHAIQKQGIELVASVYDKVVITDSYKDWSRENLPNNVEVKNIVWK